MVSAEVRERRRTLRYRKLLVRQNAQLRNKVSQMPMESGVVYNKAEAPQGRLLQGTDGDTTRISAGELPRDHRADRQDRECIDSFPAP